MPEMVEVVIDSVRVSLMSPQRVVILRQKDAAVAREKSESLAKLLKEAGAAIYGQPPPGSRETAAPPPGEQAHPGARVVDADYRETR